MVYLTTSPFCMAFRRVTSPLMLIPPGGCPGALRDQGLRLQRGAAAGAARLWSGPGGEDRDSVKIRKQHGYGSIPIDTLL